MSSFTHYIGLAIIGALLYGVIKCVYNLTLHPLARFPGPLLHRATRLSSCARLIQGRLPYDVLDLHRQYGHVVRIAPDELSFAHADAWKEIYGRRPMGTSAAGPEELPKYSTFYRNAGLPHSIVNEDRENHALLRRMLSPGFSERALRNQEPVIGGYVDLLMRQLHRHSKVRETDVQGDDDLDLSGTGCESTLELQGQQVGAPKPVDLKDWYIWTTFDVIGDLCFGEPFGGLERGRYDPWVAQLNSAGPISAWLWTIKYLGWDRVLVRLMRWLVLNRVELARRTTERLQRRMAMPTERLDLVAGLLKKREGSALEPLQIRVNVGTLVLAGSETTSTLLCGVTFLVLKHREVMMRLREEVRSSFAREEDITISSVTKLTYMSACLDEALRCYPPAAAGMPREVPTGGTTVAGEILPEGTACAVWQWSLFHNENLAHAEMRLILSKLIFNFDMELVDPGDDWLNQKSYLFWHKTPLKVYLTAVRRNE
ncbi:Cytochrome P450 monooxygenase 1 [Colletotrichum fructicola]|nr:Cytochrome P450 monooxygenase 1 [Colletotrichum fructicola]